jgi:hypothetical protein
MTFRLCLLSLCPGLAAAFVVPQPFLTPTISIIPDVTLLLTPPLDTTAAAAAVHPYVFLNSVLLSVDGGLGETVRNVFLGVTAALFFGAGLVFLYASYIIPQAAKMLEEQTKELAPALWEEYSAKIEDGETLAMRPELMQELGEKMQPIIDRKFTAQQRGETTMTVTDTIVEAEVVVDSSTTNNEDVGKDTIVDAEIVVDSDTKNEDAGESGGVEITKSETGWKD